MDFKKRRPIRTISTITLSFFIWMFAGGFEIAHAISNSQKSEVNSQTSNKNNLQSSVTGNQAITPPGLPLPQGEGKRPEGQFQRTLEGIEQILSDASTDTDAKKNRLKTSRAAIEALDVELKRQFSDTEKFLKDKGLPPVILTRHADFVKRYEANLKELRTNLDAIDKAKTEVEIKNEVEKIGKFLEKVKPPKKHVPIDPNKLPHRTAEPVFIEPRTTPDQFTEGIELRAKGIAQKPILVASNGQLKGLLSQKTEYTNEFTSNPSSSFPDLIGESRKSLDARLLTAGMTTVSGGLPDGSYQIALANPPTSADLAETIEVQFTPEIKAKAEELGKNPTKIYNWVRNNIDFVPTYGSIQGANMCLQTKQCNDFDTASLLIALFRASGIYAHYAYGTIELPIEKVMNWVGAFTDPQSALNFIASGGIPVKGLTSGGKIVKTQIEHIWVEGWLDMIPSQGAVHKQGDTWVPLDASYKQYSYTQGLDIKSAVPFDAQSFVDQIKSTATINETEAYVTNVSSSLIQQTMTDYQTQVQNYISQNYPNATVGDVLGKKEIIKQEFPVLMGTLPYKTLVAGAKYSSVPDSLRHKITFSVTSNNLYYDTQPMSITKNLPELAGKKITLSYSPATQYDADVINSYLPKPHADGSPIQPNELLSSLPAYLINLKPELRIDGVVGSTGGAIGMGEVEDFTITITQPILSAQVVNNKVTAGEYNAVAFASTRISYDQITALKSKLEQTKTKLNAQDFTGLTKDDILGDILYSTVLSYFAELYAMDTVTASTMGIAVTQLSSTGRFYMGLTVDWVFGIPLSAATGGLSMDIGLITSVPMSLNGDSAKKKQFMLASGMNSSSLEHSVPEQFFSTSENLAQGVSAVKALQIANDQGIPIYAINQSNIANILPQLQVDGYVKADIANAVAAGKEVTVSKTNITFNEWTGCGYIIVEPTAGAGAYMISGGLSGSETTVDKEFWSPFDTFFSLIDVKNTVLAQIVKSDVFEAIARRNALIYAVIEFVVDANKALERTSDDRLKRNLSLLVLGSTSALSALSAILPLGIAGGPTFTVAAIAIVQLAIHFILNFILALAFEVIGLYEPFQYYFCKRGSLYNDAKNIYLS